ncbi:hypothetical protein [Pseudonocardia sp.]|uniref:hypothetical protein n=1 Tax=Pseudonocardia sp. TaxID=60912 RepID=UPI002628F360|nr:hypothetical protein [Pseudonocardia sp.]
MYRVLRIGLTLVIVAGSLLAGNGPAALAETPAERVARCLDGGMAPRDVVDRSRFERTTYTLSCGSPISYGVLHIDDGHGVNDHGNFIACFRRMVVEAGPASEDPFRPYLVRVLNVDLGNIKAYLVYEQNGNVESMYTTGVQSNNWRACAKVSPL